MTPNNALFNQALFGGTVPPPATTSRKLGYWALRKLTVLRPGQAANLESVQDCHEALNGMMDQWNTQRLLVPQILRDVYDLTAGLQDYMIGPNLPAPNFANVRPSRVQAAFIMSAGSDYECSIRVATERNAHCPYLYIDGGFPISNIHISPAPQAGDRLVLYTWQQFGAFETLDTEYRFPPGYLLAMQFNLARQVAPDFATLMAKGSAVLLQQIESQASEYIGWIKRMNTPMPELSCDEALLRRYYDVRTGRYY